MYSARLALTLLDEDEEQARQRALLDKVREQHARLATLDMDRALFEACD